MAPAKRRVTLANIREARRVYENTNVPVDDIAAMLGVTRTTFYTRRRQWGWSLRLDRVPLAEPPREPDEIAHPSASPNARPSDTAVVAARIRQMIEHELDAVEQIVAQLKPAVEHTEGAERAARVLASLARTLQEVARLDAPRGKVATSEEDNDRGPADDDDFIRDLVRRMDEFAQRGQGAVPLHAAAELS